MSIEVLPTASPDTFEVRGRGELQLAVLIESMRREGYELQVSRPEVLLRRSTARRTSRTSASPSTSRPTSLARSRQSLAARRARLELMTTDADGRVRMEFIIPTRGLVGYRGQLLTETRGTALLHQIGAGYGPWAGEVAHRTRGVLVSDRSGDVERLRPVQPAGTLGSCSSARASRSTRAWSSARTAGRPTWTSTRPRKRS